MSLNSQKGLSSILGSSSMRYASAVVNKENSGLAEIIDATLTYSSKIAHKLPSYPDLKGKLTQLLEKVKESIAAGANANGLFGSFESDIRSTCEGIKSTCKKYATSKFKSFCKDTITKELSQYSQHLAHSLNSISIFTYMLANKSKPKPIVKENSDTKKLQEIVEDLKSQVTALSMQLSSLQNGEFQRNVALPTEEEIKEEAKHIKMFHDGLREEGKQFNGTRENNEPGMEMEKKDLLCARADSAFFGTAEPQNYKKAFQTYLEAIAEGSEKACGCIAKMYEGGLGVEMNLNEAFYYYKEGAKRGDSICLFALGKYYENNTVPEGKDKGGLEDAVAYYEQAASKNNHEALTKIGNMYEKGVYFAKNEATALDYYKRAAKLNNPLAINYVGLAFYKEGNFRQAVAHFKKSKDLGCARGANNLGMCYEQGLGVEQDLEQALVNYKDAAEKRFAQAMFNLGYLYMRKAKSNNSVEQFENAASWLRAAVAEDSQIQEAHFYLGFLFEKGLGVNVDIQQAFTYYSQAAKLGYAKAYKKCGDLMLAGHEILKPKKGDALKYYQKAAELNDPEAYNALGLMYEKGYDEVEPTEKIAKENYEKAALMGCLDAKVNLALMLLNEDYPFYNKEKGIQLMAEAAEKGDSRGKEYLVAKGLNLAMSSKDDFLCSGESFAKPKKDQPLDSGAINLQIEDKENPSSQIQCGQKNGKASKMVPKRKISESDDDFENISIGGLTPSRSPLEAKKVEDNIIVMRDPVPFSEQI